MNACLDLVFEPTVKVHESERLEETLKLMMEKAARTALVYDRNGVFRGPVYLHEILELMYLSSRPIIEMLSLEMGSFVNQKYRLINADLQRNLLLKEAVGIKAWENVLLASNGEVKGALGLRGLAALLNRVKPSWGYELYSLMGQLDIFLAPNTTIKGVMRELSSNAAGVMVVHRRGKALGIIDEFTVLKTLLEEETMRRIRQMDEDYFYYTTVATVMDREFPWVLESWGVEKMTRMISQHGYLLALKNAETRCIAAFISDRTAVSIISQVIAKL